MAAFQVAMACVVSIRGKARLETRLQPHHVPGAGSPGFFRAFPRMDPDALSAFEGWGGSFTDPRGDGVYGDRD